MPEYKGMNLIIPESDREFRPYFEAAGRGELVVRRCTACGLLRYPPGVACPWCNSLDSDWAKVSGLGTVYSYEIVTQAIQPGFSDWAPYAVVLIELDEQRGQPTPEEGLRLIANLVTADLRPEDPQRIAIGKRVKAVFMPLADGLALPQFALSAQPAEGRVWSFPG